MKIDPIRTGQLEQKKCLDELLAVINEAAGSLQLCAGQVARAEAAIHPVHIFIYHKTEGILLIDAENFFYSINSKVMLHNLKLIFLVISTYISSCHKCSAKLFIIGGDK